MQKKLSRNITGYIPQTNALRLCLKIGNLLPIHCQFCHVISKMLSETLGIFRVALLVALLPIQPLQSISSAQMDENHSQVDGDPPKKVAWHGGYHISK